MVYELTGAGNAYVYSADSSFPPSQWEMALLCNDVPHWLGTSPESAPYVPVHFAVFGSISGLSPVRRQNTTWANAYLSSNWPQNIFQWHSTDIKINASSYK